MLYQNQSRTILVKKKIPSNNQFNMWFLYQSYMDENIQLREIQDLREWFTMLNLAMTFTDPVIFKLNDSYQAH